MKVYKDTITLNKNNRGCYILDTVKGCPGGQLHSGKGCYGDCYAKNIAYRYGFDFEKLMARRFQNNTAQLYLFGLSDRTHTNKIRKEIESADMPFVRIGEMGDPSGDWEHTLSVCNEIKSVNKKIVIITKHWDIIPEHKLKEVEGICINTSISALDTEEQIEHRLSQYERLKNICNSVLRIVTCDFNKKNVDGVDKHLMQSELLKIPGSIDTVFRPSKNNPIVINGLINIKKVKFLKATVLASIHDDKIYMGGCKNCPDMCGINRC